MGVPRVAVRRFWRLYNTTGRPGARSSVDLKIGAKWRVAAVPQPRREGRRCADHACGGQARCGRMPCGGPSAHEVEPAATSGSGSARVRPGRCVPGEAVSTASGGCAMGAIASGGGWLACRGRGRAGGLAVPAGRGRRDV